MKEAGTRGMDEERLLHTVEALCRLAERCQATAKFSESKFDWYMKSEQYTAAACKLMDDVISRMKEEQ